MGKTRLDSRVMLDANVLIAGSVWPRWPYEVLQHALRASSSWFSRRTLLLRPKPILPSHFQITPGVFVSLLKDRILIWSKPPPNSE